MLDSRAEIKIHQILEYGDVPFEEEYILRSPVKKLHKIKGEKTLKQPFTDEDITT